MGLAHCRLFLSLRSCFLGGVGCSQQKAPFGPAWEYRQVYPNATDIYTVVLWVDVRDIESDIGTLLFLSNGAPLLLQNESINRDTQRGVLLKKMGGGKITPQMYLQPFRYTWMHAGSTHNEWLKSYLCFVYFLVFMRWWWCCDAILSNEKPFVKSRSN